MRLVWWRKGGGSVIFDDIVEIVGDVCLAEMRGAGCAL
jgi:hypothetical protein